MEMEKHHRRAIVDQGIAMAIEQGCEPHKVQAILQRDTFLMVQFVECGLARFSSHQVAHYITDSIRNSEDSDYDDGGASQADYSPMGNLANLRSSLRSI